MGFLLQWIYYYYTHTGTCTDTRLMSKKHVVSTTSSSYSSTHTHRPNDNFTFLQQKPSYVNKIRMESYIYFVVDLMKKKKSLRSIIMHEYCHHYDCHHIGINTKLNTSMNTGTLIIYRRMCWKGHRDVLQLSYKSLNRTICLFVFEKKRKRACRQR